MRPRPTQIEDTAIEALMNRFRSEGHTAHVIPRTVEDRPDRILRVANAIVACECTQIPPAEVYYQHVKKPNPDESAGFDLVCTLWANEPHVWVANAISSKDAMAPDYRARTGATNLWLLIHTPAEPNQFFVDGAKEWSLRAMRYVASTTTHQFSQIFLWTPQNGIEPLFAPGPWPPVDTHFAVDFRDGYPTHAAIRTSACFRTARENGMEPRLFHYARTVAKQVIIPPQDPNYTKHDPAIRRTSYDFTIRASAESAELQPRVIFPDEGTEFDLKPQHITSLQPDTQYHVHYLHEVGAPKRLRTIHQRDCPGGLAEPGQPAG